MEKMYQTIRPLCAIAVLLFTFSASSKSLEDLQEFGQNPGDLSGKLYLAQESADLIVLLHGCGQSGITFSISSELLSEAKKSNVNLLIPQQNKENNSTLCFNWFSPEDQVKGKGESQSIANMIYSVKQNNSIERVFLIGFSAGGAMASNLLINYPDLFTAGAVVAGIPFPCADDLVKAISCMKIGSSVSSGQLAKKAYQNRSHWPELVIVTGREDNIVNPINSQQMAEQWVLLNNSNFEKTIKKQFDWTISQWHQANVELIEIENMGHGFPITFAQSKNNTQSTFLHPNSISLASYLLDKWKK